MFSSIPGFYQLDASSTPFWLVTIKNVLWEAESPPVEKDSLRKYQSSARRHPVYYVLRWKLEFDVGPLRAQGGALSSICWVSWRVSWTEDEEDSAGVRGGERCPTQSEKDVNGNWWRIQSVREVFIDVVVQRCLVPMLTGLEAPA